MLFVHLTVTFKSYHSREQKSAGYLIFIDLSLKL